MHPGASGRTQSPWLMGRNCGASSGRGRALAHVDDENGMTALKGRGTPEHVKPGRGGGPANAGHPGTRPSNQIIRTPNASTGGQARRTAGREPRGGPDEVAPPRTEATRGGPEGGLGSMGGARRHERATCIPRPLGTGRLRAAGLFPQTALPKQACPSQGRTQCDLGTFCLSQG